MLQNMLPTGWVGPWVGYRSSGRMAGRAVQNLLLECCLTWPRVVHRARLGSGGHIDNVILKAGR